MILTGREIEREHRNRRIRISDFDAHRINTNSYDVRLGSRLLRYTNDVLDPAADNPHESIEIPREGFLLNQGDFVLASTQERVGSDHYVPLLHARSGVARLGLFVHVTADLVDIGFYGRLTLQLHATLPIRLHPDMQIAQVSFWKPQGEIELYSGKYQDSTGPRASEAYRDARIKG